jgi:hypothetical protein
MKKGILGTIAALTLGAAGLQAQTGGLIVGRGGGAAAGAFIEQFQQAGTIAARAAGGRGLTMINGNSSQTVIGRPVSATEEQKSKQTLGDGTEISTSESDRFYRDSAGRTRVEMASQGRTVITDPVARFTVTLNPNAKIARRNAMPASPEPRMGVALSAAPISKLTASTYTVMIGNTAATVTTGDSVPAGRGGRAGRGNAENMLHEDLGVQQMNGLTATGTRDTLTIPQGQIGNNRDIHVVNERWYSEDLQMLVKTVNSDPRFGENTYELTNISRDEPDASLFQIPAGYRVVDVGADTVFQAIPVTPPDK